MSRFMGTKVLNGREQYYVQSVEPDGQILLIDGPSITLANPAQTAKIRTGDIIRFYADGSRHFIMHTRPHNQSVDGTARLISYITEYTRSDDFDEYYDEEPEETDFDDASGNEADESDDSESSEEDDGVDDTDDSK